MATHYIAPEVVDESGNTLDTILFMADHISMSDKSTTVETEINTLKGYFTSGSANTAIKLKTARTIALTGSVTGSGSFDGSGNLSIATTTNHTHSYAGSSSAGGAATKAISDNAGQQIDTTYIKALSVSGKVITYTKGDGTTGTITTQDTNTTYGTMGGATASAAGTSGLVPAPGAGKNLSFLRGDGTWVVPTDTKYSVMTGATSSAAGAAGLVPAPASGKQASFLRGDGTWATPTNTTYSAGAGISLSGTTFSNSGVRSIATGSTNGTISVNTGGTSAEVAVKGLGSAAYTASSAYAAASHTHSYAGSGSAGGSANSAVKLATARTIALAGAFSASGSFDGSANLTLTVSSMDATKLTGTVPVECIPPAALERLVTVADDTARFALTTSDIQVGDLVKVEATGKVWYVKDQSNLSSADGYEEFTVGTAASVPWSGVTGKPSTFTPASHTHNYAGSSSAGGSANSAVKLDTATAGSATQPVYFSGGKPVACTYTLGKSVPSNAVFTDTVYTHPTSAGNKHVPSGGSSGNILVWSAAGTAAWGTNAPTATKATQDSAGQQIDTTYIKSLSVSGKVITYTRGDDTTGTITTQDTNTTYSVMGAASSSAAGTAGLVPAPAAGKQTSFLRGDGTWVVPTNTTYSAGAGLSLSGTTFAHSNSVTAGTAQGDASKTLTFGGTFTVPTVTYDANGHITGKGTTTMTMPAAPTTVSGNAGSATKLATARTLDGVSFNGTAAITHYGICETAAATAAKVVSLAGFTLVTGARIAVKFTVTNTAGSPTLNVNSTGAKAIQYRGSAISAGYLAANRLYEFIYDGTNYQLVGDINTNTTYSAGTGISLSGTTFSNSGVRSIATGSTNGTISVNTGGSSAEVAVKGLGSAAYTESSAYATSGHTHNYAGSSSAGGSATSAVKLDSSAGSATQPVYFSGGKPVACTYTLGKSVPSNAVFTDTNTWRGIQNNLTSTSTSDSLSAAQGKVLNDKITSGYTRMSASAAGVVSLPNGFKMVYGTVKASDMTLDSTTNTYKVTIDLSSYSLTAPVFANQSVVGVSSPVVQTSILEATATSLVLESLSNSEKAVINWMVIG